MGRWSEVRVGRSAESPEDVGIAAWKTEADVLFQCWRQDWKMGGEEEVVKVFS